MLCPIFVQLCAFIVTNSESDRQTNKRLFWDKYLLYKMCFVVKFQNILQQGSVCLCVCLCEDLCVCVPNVPTVIVTPVNFDLMGKCFWSPRGNKFINHTALGVLKI